MRSVNTHVYAQPLKQCNLEHSEKGISWAVRAALPNVGEHLRLALPLTGKTKVAQLEQRRIIIRQQRIVQFEVSVQAHRGWRESLNRERFYRAAYPICVCMLASS